MFKPSTCPENRDQYTLDLHHDSCHARLRCYEVSPPEIRVALRCQAKM